MCKSNGKETMTDFFKQKSSMNMHKGHINGMSDNFHQFLFGTVFLCRPYLHIWISIQSTCAVNGLRKGLMC